MTKILSQDDFQKQIVSQYTDVIGEKLGGKVLSFSDQWFADAENLIKPKPPIRDATRFTYAGAWYDGWETRRHNEAEADWVIFKLGVSSAKLIACEVDTAFSMVIMRHIFLSRHCKISMPVTKIYRMLKRKIGKRSLLKSNVAHCKNISF